MSTAATTRKILVLVLFGILIGQAKADVVLTPSQDTTIAEHPGLGGPDSTHGSDLYLYAIRGGVPTGGYQSYPLLQFDLTAFAGQTVNGPATLQLFAETAFPLNPTPRNISVHEILVPWNANTATFNNFGPAPGVDAGDIGPSLDTQTFVFDAGHPPRYITWTIPASVVQGWIDNPGSNNGLLMDNLEIRNEHDVDFFSSENINPPLLAFSVGVPEPASLILAGVGGVLFAGSLLARRKGGRPALSETAIAQTSAWWSS